MDEIGMVHARKSAKLKHLVITPKVNIKVQDIRDISKALDTRTLKQLSSYIIDLVLSVEGHPFHPCVPSSKFLIPG